MREEAVGLGPRGSLVGVVTHPDRPPAVGTWPAVVILSAGLVHRVGPARLHVAIARRLAAAGFCVTRFDVSGVGDSPPRGDGVPYPESAVRDTAEVMTSLEEHTGARHFVLMGLCAGADNAFRTACVDPRVVALALLDGYPYRTPGYWVRRYAPRLVRAETWGNVVRGRTGVVAWLRRAAGTGGRAGTRPPRREGMAVRRFPPREQTLADIQMLVRRGVRLYFLYSGGMQDWYNHRRQFWEAFPSLRSGRAVVTDYFAEADHTFTDVAARARLLSALERWLRDGAWDREASCAPSLAGGQPVA